MNHSKGKKMPTNDMNIRIGQMYSRSATNKWPLNLDGWILQFFEFE